MPHKQLSPASSCPQGCPRLAAARGQRSCSEGCHHGIALLCVAGKRVVYLRLGLWVVTTGTLLDFTPAFVVAINTTTRGSWTAPAECSVDQSPSLYFLDVV